ncbi:hypothetical protein COCCADRAFT_90467 [Bipolaris zeicola 26-R-13]|uniref:Uncharacterized protein n=1 Tax=Cochliobolus carbonum (strain 26-R-13) TaxID=930089 RepID=W6YIX2_COCC2|nr:uncharacterized protein COCCADRAFT_90467 [Bipolaris zeicola 26-R-13]EUC35569.1 hypothetical protein COCCADRAFT_90467 [Bipolaris zeicola 26-R-13]
MRCVRVDQDPDAGTIFYQDPWVKRASEDLVILNLGSMPLAITVRWPADPCRFTGLGGNTSHSPLGRCLCCLWHWFPACFIARMIFELC